MRLKLHKEWITSRNCRINANGCEWSQFIQQMLVKLSLHPQTGKKCGISSNGHQLVVGIQHQPPSACSSSWNCFSPFFHVASVFLINFIFPFLQHSKEPHGRWQPHKSEVPKSSPVLWAEPGFLSYRKENASSKEYGKCVYLVGQKNVRFQTGFGICYFVEL